jgi:multiple sugar transport system substrate-binding protein
MASFHRRFVLAAGLAAPLFARAQSREVEIVAQYPSPANFRGLMEDIAAEFMRRNPGLRVAFRAPEEDYEALLQRSLRDAMTRSLPDVAFHGLNRQRTLAERGIPVDMAPLLRADPEMASLGYSPALLSLGEVEGQQTGIGFAISTPIFYYNAEHVRRAGGDPDALPTRFDDIIALARAIHGEGTTGLWFDWTITGNWSFQSLLFSHAGRMLDEATMRPAFADPPGKAGLGVLHQMVTEGRMPDIRPATMAAEFFGGRMGISMQSTAQLGRYNREIGGRFRLVCGGFPIAAPEGRLPAGGNVAVLFARDEQKQRAAFEFIKFATGPIGATKMVHHTGYMPATTIPAERDELLGRFYRDNPNHRVSLAQQAVMTGWYAFPGQNALKITDVINDHVQPVVAQRAAPDAALDAMARDVGALLPRRRS